MEFHVNAAKGDAVCFGQPYHAASANHTLEDRISGIFLYVTGLLETRGKSSFGNRPWNSSKDMPLETLKLFGLTTSELILAT
ncbi:ADQ_G0034300.mRNA.1.CDS.1 [Saccharomyces cerevisiae]|nr:ADQ_G0034300.mRNA.1.CDS.1 [Saccharomyces cerevisiae]CAI6783178.1 ADQ_G0034300.mRNA.1.CDS.1 [Saccharomyces cerevisiae]